MVQPKLEGKVAIITGAAAGLGEGIAQVYAKYGAKICMVDLSADVDRTADKIREMYPDADIVTVMANVADKDQMIAAARQRWTLSVRSTSPAAMPAYVGLRHSSRCLTRCVISTST